MGLENCPDWVCGRNNVPYDYIYLLAGILMSVPYLLFVKYIYRQLSPLISLPTGCLILVALLFGYSIYCNALMLLLMNSESRVVEFMVMALYAPAITCASLSVFGLIGVVIVWCFDQIPSSSNDEE